MIAADLEPSSLREASRSDEEAVVALWEACGLVMAHNDPAADFRFALAGPASAVLVAESADERIIGAIMVGHDGHRGWIYYVATDPPWRERGVGRALVRAAEAWLRARGVPKLQLMIRETNPQVAEFYAKLGFEVMPRINMQKWLGA